MATKKYDPSWKPIKINPKVIFGGMKVSPGTGTMPCNIHQQMKLCALSVKLLWYCLCVCVLCRPPTTNSSREHFSGCTSWKNGPMGSSWVWYFRHCQTQLKRPNVIPFRIQPESRSHKTKIIRNKSTAYPAWEVQEARIEEKWNWCRISTFRHLVGVAVRL